jgi:hypothetical protein
MEPGAGTGCAHEVSFDGGSTQERNRCRCFRRGKATRLERKSIPQVESRERRDLDQGHGDSGAPIRTDGVVAGKGRDAG